MFKAVGAAVLGLAIVGAQACATNTMAPEESVDTADQAYGSCAGLKTWKSNDYTFTVKAGEVIQYNNVAYKANVAVSYPNAECVPSNPAGWCANWFTSQGACGSTTTTTTTTNTDPCAGVSYQGGTCGGNSGIDGMMGSLAIAMANELGRLEATTDLKVNGDRLDLSTAGQNRCNANGGCDNTKAILAMQDTAINNYVCAAIFDATSYRSNLKSSFQLQKDREASAAMNGGLPPAAELSLASTAPASCGTDWTYNVKKAGCTSGSTTTTTSSGGSCNGLPTWQGNNYQFTPKAGDMIQLNGRKYKANVNISYPNAECAPNAPASWCANWFSDQGACGSSSSTTTTTTTSCDLAGSNVSLKMGFFRDNNPVVNFRTSGNTITIDPTGTMNGDTTSGSGSCTAACTAFNPSGSLVDGCCLCNNKYGSFAKTTLLGGKVVACAF
jgi:hypothetical protein